MPRSSAWDESAALAEWAQKECRHLDLVASWEVLTGIYTYLGFTGPVSDEVRLEEFKRIIGEMNKHLTRMRTGLANTRSLEDAIEFLGNHVNTADMSTVTNRPAIAYNKLKQRWIMSSIAQLESVLEVLREESEEEGAGDD